jgi:hypothetical protein
MIRLALALFALIWASVAQAEVLSVPCAPSPPSAFLSGCAPAIAPIVSAAAEGSHVFKPASGTVVSITFTNTTATAALLVLLNATAVPADGAITPLACVQVGANSAVNATAKIDYAGGPAASFSTGIVAVATSAATCFTKTTGVVSGFFSGLVL